MKKPHTSASGGSVAGDLMDALTLPTRVQNSSVTPNAAEPATAPSLITTRLVCVVGADLGRSFSVGPAPVVIGRGSVEVPLKAQDVSRSHARISASAGGHVIEDLGSTNGTRVNNVLVAGTATLQLGDRIQVGSTILVFTHHDELEARMQQTQRLEAMSALAGGLAHDFNNALQIILANAAEVTEQLPASSADARRAVDEIQQAAIAASGLAKRLMNLGRSVPTVVDVVDLPELVDETLAMTRHALGKHISTTLDVAPKARVRGSREELQQMLINFFINARDAMVDGGRLIVAVRIVQLDRFSALSHQLSSEGAYVEIAVTDTGTGMDDATRARVFEPFFTTKSTDQGTGLGLAMVHSIVRRHGGAVLVESALNHGTTFRTLLPSADASS